MPTIPNINAAAVKAALVADVVPVIDNIQIPIVEILEAAGVPKTIADVVQDVFGHSLSADLQQQVIASLSRRLTNQLTRSSAQMMGHAITKAIDGIIDGQMGSVSVDDRLKVAQALADQAAAQFIQAAERLHEYPACQAEVVRDKESKQDPTAARKQRQVAQDNFTDHLINVGRLLAGDVPHPEQAQGK